MKKYIFFSFILVVIGLLLAIDSRTLKLVKLISKSEKRGSEVKFNADDYYDKLPADARNRKLVRVYFSPSSGFNNIESLIDKDYGWLAAWAWDLCRYDLSRDKKAEKKLYEILAKLRKLDPNNGCPDYIESVINYRKAVKRGIMKNELLNRAALEKAVSLYMRAVRKPYMKLYQSDRVKRVVKVLASENDTLGVIQRRNIYSAVLLPQVGSVREIARMAVFYAELLDKEGKKAESRKVLASGRDFITKWAQHNSDCLIEHLVYRAAIGIFHNSAIKLKDKKMIKLYGRAFNELKIVKNKQNDNKENARRYGGYFSNKHQPADIIKIPVEAFNSDRKLTYLAYDRLALMIFSISCAVIIILLTCGAVLGKMNGNEVRLVEFSGRTWAVIICVGMVLPMVLFLIFSGVDVIGGRDTSIFVNRTGFYGGIALLALMWIWLAETLRIEIKKTGKINFASHCLSKILPYAIFLVMAEIILGSYFAISESYYLRKDPLFCAAKFLNCPEDAAVKKRTEKMIKLLK